MIGIYNTLSNLLRVRFRLMEILFADKNEKENSKWNKPAGPSANQGAGPSANQGAGTSANQGAGTSAKQGLPGHRSGKTVKGLKKERLESTPG